MNSEQVSLEVFFAVAGERLCGVSGRLTACVPAVVLRGVPLDERQTATELDAVLQHHHVLQEKLAEDMLHLARNLKNNTMAAQNIIKQDNQVGQSDGELRSRAAVSYFRFCVRFNVTRNQV